MSRDPLVFLKFLVLQERSWNRIQRTNRSNHCYCANESSRLQSCCLFRKEAGGSSSGLFFRYQQSASCRIEFALHLHLAENSRPALLVCVASDAFRHGNDRVVTFGTSYLGFPLRHGTSLYHRRNFYERNDCPDPDFPRRHDGDRRDSQNQGNTSHS